MDIENTKAQMRKGILEYCILTVLSKDSCYASDIIRELKKPTDSRRRNPLSIADKTKKCRPSKLPMGGITTGTSKKIL
jgi:hypothetical protein